MSKNEKMTIEERIEKLNKLFNLLKRKKETICKLLREADLELLEIDFALSNVSEEDRAEMEKLNNSPYNGEYVFSLVREYIKHGLPIEEGFSPLNTIPFEIMCGGLRGLINSRVNKLKALK